MGEHLWIFDGGIWGDFYHFIMALLLILRILFGSGRRRGMVPQNQSVCQSYEVGQSLKQRRDSGVWEWKWKWQ